MQKISVDHIKSQKIYNFQSNVIKVRANKL